MGQAILMTALFSSLRRVRIASSDPSVKMVRRCIEGGRKRPAVEYR